MKLDIKKLLQKVTPYWQKFRRYLVIIVFVIFVMICSYLVVRIGQLVRAEPSDDAVAEQLKTIKRPQVDPATLNKIQQLQDQNLDVKALFDQARNNPFSE